MINKLAAFIQNKTEYLYENSLFLQNIDQLILASMLFVFGVSTFASSDMIGFIALITVFLTIIRFLTTKGDKISPRGFEVCLVIYFMIVIISLFGSTLFYLSMKGFFKTLTYMGFYFSAVHYLKNHRNKIPLVIGFIGLCVGFEGIIAFLQNFAKPEAISTWQDTTNLNPEEVMNRVYGSLKPYNPNLLGGYFVAGIPALIALCANSFVDKKNKWGFATLALTLITCISLFTTGCRGSYIGLMVILFGVFLIAAKFMWAKYKKQFLSVVGGIAAFGITAIMSITALRSRVFSIFAMRQDSSNSFRFNVYQSSVNMFKDNWLLGIGCGNQNFREIYGLYMRTGFDALSTYNVFLEIGVESGVFALFAFLAFLGILVYRGVWFILNSLDTKATICTGAALISVIAVMIHGFVDTVFFRPQLQMLFWTMVAIASANIGSMQDKLQENK